MNEDAPKVSPHDLVVRYGITYKKFTNIQFNGYVRGDQKGLIRTGREMVFGKCIT